MSNPILYDFRKTFASKTVAFLIIAMIAFAAAVLVLANSGPGGIAATSQGVGSANVQLWDYYAVNGYHFVGYAFNQYGSPIPGATFKVIASANGGATYNGEGTTNGSGWATFGMQVPSSSGAGITISVTDSSGNSLINGGQQQGNLQQYQNSTQQGGMCIGACVTGVQTFGQPVSAIVEQSDPGASELAVSELGPDGSSPANWGVYYSFSNVQPSQTAMQTLKSSQMQLLGHLSGVLTILPMFPSTTEEGVTIGIFNANGKQVWSGYQPVQSFQIQSQQQVNYPQPFGGFFTSVESSTNQTQTAWAFYELGPNGTTPSDWGAYYKFVSSLPSQVAMQALTPSQMQLLGHINAIRTILPAPAPSGSMKDVVVAVFAPDGKLVQVTASPVQNVLQGHPPWTADFWAYPTANSYHFVGLATDQYGNPLAGANVTLSMAVGSSTYNETVFTNSSGLASFEVVCNTNGGAIAQVIITPPNTNLPPWSNQNGLQGYSVSQVPWSANFWGYATADSFHLLGLATSEYGTPLVGVNCNISVSVGSSIFNQELSTNSTGFVSYTLKAPTSSGAGVSVTMTPANPSLQPWSAQNQINPYNSQQNKGNELGVVQSLVGGGGATRILDESNVSETELLYAILGPNGTAPPKTFVYYKYTSIVPSYQELQQMNESEMQLLGSTTGYVSVLQTPPPAPSNTTSLITAAFTSSGQEIAIASSSYSSGSSPATGLGTLLTIDLALFVPVAGVLAAFGAYGKERVNGVLDSVLTRPVSRRALAGSRYASVLLTLAVASVIVVEAVAILCSLAIGFSISLSWQLVLVLGAFVEAAAYAGILFVLSRLFKSASLILGPAAGLYILTSFIPMVLSNLPYWSNFLLPGRYISMCEYYILHFNLLGRTAGVALQFGSSALVLIGDAALWLAIPCAAFLFLSVKRD
ncbi:MAG: ABC transporter permease subunit [Nitrososphaerales archaeon]